MILLILILLIAHLQITVISIMLLYS